MISIIYLTNRIDPKFDWFWDSFLAQNPSNYEVIVVDYFEEGFEEAFENYRVGRVKPKPSMWQGAYRKTASEYFAAANARNTGVVHAKGDYVVFVDDVSVLLPGWWNAVVRASKEGYCVAGAYKKVWELQVEKGEVVNFRSELGGVDSRWNQGGDQPVRIGGGQLFGCSFGCRREDYLKINGQDEICDSVGGEDYNFGIRLERSGVPIYYDRTMLTYESEELHSNNGPVFKRVDKVISKERYEELMGAFGISKRWQPDGKYDKSHFIMDLVMASDENSSIYTPLLQGTPEEVNERCLYAISKAQIDFFDGQLLSEM